MISTKQTPILEESKNGKTDHSLHSREGVEANSTRKIALVAGVLFLITFIISIPAQLLLYHPLLSDPAKYMLGTGADRAVSLGALLEVMLAVAGVGTAVVLYPVVKRQNEIVVLAYVTSRVLESAAIMVGIVSLLSVVTLRQHVAGTAGADTALLIIAGKSLVAIHDAAFLLGPTFLAGLGNGVLLGYLMYTSGLVPRGLALLGLIGGPLVIAATVCVLFGVFKAGSSWQAIATILEFIWELSFGIFLIVKGFRPSPITSVSERTREMAEPLPRTTMSHPAWRGDDETRPPERPSALRDTDGSQEVSLCITPPRPRQCTERRMFALNELLAGATPLRSIDDLAIEA